MKVPSFTQAIMVPFAASVEVFLRHSFGIRYWSFTRFISGLIVIGLFRLVYGISEIGQSLIGALVGGQGSQSLNWIYVIWLCYLLAGIYHFVHQAYHEAVGKQILTSSMGQSRLFAFGKLLLALLNRIAAWLVKVALPYIPTKDQRRLREKPIQFSDYRAFTFRVVEPMCVFVLSQVFSLISGMVSFWLLTASIMLALHSSLHIAEQRAWKLDKRDEAILASRRQGETPRSTELEDTQGLLTRPVLKAISNTPLLNH